jgi:protease-4
MSKKRRWPWVLLASLILLAAFGGCIAGLAFFVSLSQGGFALGDAVAIVRVEGFITSGRPTFPYGVHMAYSDLIIEEIRRAQDDPRVKAIVLRIESPGGEVVASDEIYNEILKAEKPVVASMGDIAASGGYYIACAADKIVANPATLTGSIGVISQIPNVEELMKKLGIEMRVIKSGPHKDLLSPFREMTEEEMGIWQDITDEVYEMFVGMVAERRNLPQKKIKEIADGRVYTGKQALELGLVDELGNLSEAVDLAAELGGIVGKPRIVEYRRLPSFFEVLTGLTSHPQLLDLFYLLDIWGRPSLQFIYSRSQ